MPQNCFFVRICDFSVAFIYMILALGKSSGQWEEGSLGYHRDSGGVSHLSDPSCLVVGGFITLVGPPAANRS